MEPKASDLVGCTLEGEPIIAEIERQECAEAGRELASTVRERRRTIIRHFPAGSLAPESSRVSRRVRHYTDDEIREAKGIMSKPFKTQFLNALWMVRQAGSSGVTTTEIGKEIGIRQALAANLMHYTFKRMYGTGILGREMVKGQYRYYWNKMDITVESAAKASRLARKLGPTKGKDASTKLPKREAPAAPVEVSPPLAKAIKEAIGATLGVKVSGSIEVVIRLDLGKE